MFLSKNKKTGQGFPWPVKVSGETACLYPRIVPDGEKWLLKIKATGMGRPWQQSLRM